MKLYLPITPVLNADPRKFEPVTHVAVSVTYQLGGGNMLAGNADPRGLYASVTPVTRRGDGIESWVMFTGYKHLLARLNRASAKRLSSERIEVTDQIARRVGPVWAVVERVAWEAGATIDPQWLEATAPVTTGSVTAYRAEV